MAYISYDKLWRSEFYNNVSAKNRVQDFNLNQIKLKVNDTFRKEEKITTNFGPSDDSDVSSKTNLDTKLSKTVGSSSIIGNNYNELKFRNDKQSEAVLLEIAVKTTIQILYDKGLFDKYDSAYGVIKDYLLTEEINQRRRPHLEDSNDDESVIQ